jgi:hypothetical protein
VGAHIKGRHKACPYDTGPPLSRRQTDKPLQDSALNEIDQPQVDVREEIARLEARIESLASSVERCRKISLAARLVLLIGAAWFVLIVLRVIPFGPIHIIGALSAMIGGTVLYGSNASTWKQRMAAAAEAEARRAELIDSMTLRIVADAADS